MMRFVTRALALLLFVALFALSCVGCADVSHEAGDAEIVCTIYPIYDWVCAILGEHRAEYPVRLLSENGNDPHNYQPTVRDLIEVSNATLLLCVGGVSDAWTSEVAKPRGEVLMLLDAVEVCEADHGGEEHHHEHDHAHEEIDEHFWLSPMNAKRAVSVITETLAVLYADDGEAVADFRANAASYMEMLEALDGRYRAAVAEAERDTVLFADRFPFLYLTEEYGIRYHAAFPGCSAEVEAGFSTVLELTDAAKELELSVILVTETGDTALAETIWRNTGHSGEILTLHSCQSVTRAERAAGVTYLSIMEENLSVLARALAGS